MRFYTGKMFPSQYQNAIFIARHGSWNRTKKIGGNVIVVKLNKDGSVKWQEPFLTGFLQNNEYSGRPVDVQVLKDGSLLVSDDHAGAVYRVIYGAPRSLRVEVCLAGGESSPPTRVRCVRPMGSAQPCHFRRTDLLIGVARNADTLEARLAPCLACHGANGQSTIPEVPSLGGQPAFYLTIELLMFREKLWVVNR